MSSSGIGKVSSSVQAFAAKAIVKPLSKAAKSLARRMPQSPLKTTANTFKAATSVAASKVGVLATSVLSRKSEDKTHEKTENRSQKMKLAAQDDYDWGDALKEVGRTSSQEDRAAVAKANEDYDYQRGEEDESGVTDAERSAKKMGEKIAPELSKTKKSPQGIDRTKILNERKEKQKAQPEKLEKFEWNIDKKLSAKGQQTPLLKNVAESIASKKAKASKTKKKEKPETLEKFYNVKGKKIHKLRRMKAKDIEKMSMDDVLRNQ